MKKHILGLVVAAGALWVAAPGCDQPNVECTVGTASANAYAAKYTLVSADPADSAENPCVSPGDMIGMQVYNPNNGSDKPDTSTKELAIQAGALGSLQRHYLADTTEGHTLYSLGRFNNVEPDSRDLCTVPTLSPAQQELKCSLNAVACTKNADCCSQRCVIPEDADEGTCQAPPPDECEGGGNGTGGGGTGGGGTGGGGTGGAGTQTDRDITYEWSNVNIYVTPSALGNQAQADLTVRDSVKECSATYKVTMLWPAVGCEELVAAKAAHPPNENDPDDPCDDDPGIPCNPSEPETCVACDLLTDPDCEAVGTGKPNNDLCDDEPDPEPPYLLPNASGISPDLRVKCDESLLLCVLDSESIPAFK